MGSLFWVKPNVNDQNVNLKQRIKIELLIYSSIFILSI